MGMARLDQNYVGAFKEREHGKSFEFDDKPPCDWSKGQGATHTVYVNDFIGANTRPAKVLKTVAYVGIDMTDEGGILWEKWQVRRLFG